MIARYLRTNGAKYICEIEQDKGLYVVNIYKNIVKGEPILKRYFDNIDNAIVFVMNIKLGL